MDTSPFKKPDKPNNSWELFKWVWFEYRLLEKYGKTITKTEMVSLILKTYLLCIVPLVLLLYVISMTIVIGMDLPSWISTEYKEYFIIQWTSNASFVKRFELLFFYGYSELMIQLVCGLLLGLGTGLAVDLIRGLAVDLARGLAVDLARGLAVDLARGLAVCLAVGLAVGLTGGLAVGLAGDLVVGLAVGLAIGLAVGLTGGLAGLTAGLTVGLVGGLIFSLVGGLIFSLVGSLIFGLALGLTLGIFYYIGYFRLPFYPFYFIKSLFACQLKKNVYFQDDAIYLPIWGLKDKLTQQAQQDPKTAQQFINFLLEYRPLQIKLAMHLTHAATAGDWNRKLLDTDKLNPPAIIQQADGLIPSDKWLRALTTLKEQLIHTQNQSNIHQIQQGYQSFLNQLIEFRELTLHEPYQWHKYYLNTLDNWITASQQMLSKKSNQKQKR